MRVGIKAKQIAALTAIVGLAVVALSAVHVARLARVVLHESQARGELLANTIFHRSREVVVAGGTSDLYTALRNDPGLRAILGPLVDGSALDQVGTIYARDGRTLEVRQQMVLGDEPFGSIRIGVSTVLVDGKRQ